MSGSIIFGNLVTDFLTTIDKTALINMMEKNDMLAEIPADKGLLDFLADIEEKIEYMTSLIGELAADLNTMNAGIDSCVSEMKRVQKTGGSGAAAFMRKEARKAAAYMSEYGGSLRKRNAELSEVWPVIEKSRLQLLENKHTHSKENKTGLAVFLKSLDETKNASVFTSEATEGMPSVYP